MNYPYAFATGNAVIAAALEWEDARRYPANPHDHPARYFRACQALEAAAAAHRKATTTEHVNGPDIDAEVPSDTPTTPAETRTDPVRPRRTPKTAEDHTA